MNAVWLFFLRLLLIVLSYTFVGWIGYIIYTDLRQIKTGHNKISPAPITLIAQIDQKVIERKFQKPEIILGRDPACDFPLDDGTISLRHCKLLYHHKQWWAQDLQSTNGSYLNNSLIETNTILTDSDELQLGSIKLSIKFTNL
jgi:pSer/pThr/pTyr-binding forkhead associated (FHA) protein